MRYGWLKMAFAARWDDMRGNPSDGKVSGNDFHRPCVERALVRAQDAKGSEGWIGRPQISTESIPTSLAASRLVKTGFGINPGDAMDHEAHPVVILAPSAGA